ncbi:hypothetical protein MMC06_005393 [Schaereria dolodes]|nr:hypothetical protein [Schaereria dolodes]
MPSAELSISVPLSSLPQSHPQASKLFSLSLSRSDPARSSTKFTFNPQKRSHSSLTEDSDSGIDERGHGPLLVSTFDHSAGGAIGINGTKKEKAPLVIAGQQNHDWSWRKGKNLLSKEVQAAREKTGRGVEGEEKDVVDGAVQTYGLIYAKRRDVDGDVEMNEVGGRDKTTPFDAGSVTKALTADEEALEALVGDGNRKSELFLPLMNGPREDDEMIPGKGIGTDTNEDDAFKIDVASRPDSASLDDYAAVPIEKFGAALLRGMGWKDGDVVGKRRKTQISKTRVVEKRPALLGIGAKEAPGDLGDELGAWGKAAKGKRKADKTYAPVLLKNTKTGEMLTEEELKVKTEGQKREEEDWRARRDRNLAHDEGKKERRRHRDDYASEERNRNLSSAKGRDRAPGPSRHRISGRDRSKSSDRRYQLNERYDDGDKYNQMDKNYQRIGLGIGRTKPDHGGVKKDPRRGPEMINGLTTTAYKRDLSLISSLSLPGPLSVVSL